MPRQLVMKQANNADKVESGQGQGAMVEMAHPPFEHLQTAPAQAQKATEEAGHHWKVMENFESTPTK